MAERLRPVVQEQREWFAKNGWNEASLQRFHRAEGYFLKLLLSRRQPTKHPLGDDVDALFGEPGKPLRFVGESGKYEAGKLAAAEAAKLPKDSLEIVEQLVLWLPQDMRLNWLLGELFNSEGDVEAALEIFKGIGITEKYHHEVWGLFNYRPKNVKALDTLGKVGSKGKEGYPPVLLKHIEVLKAYQEKQQKNLEAGLGPEKAGNQKTAPVTPRPNSTGDIKEEPLIDLRTLGVGFGFGLLVAFFGYWQYREIRRRRLPAAQARS